MIHKRMQKIPCMGIMSIKKTKYTMKRPQHNLTHIAPLHLAINIISFIKLPKYSVGYVIRMLCLFVCMPVLVITPYTSKTIRNFRIRNNVIWDLFTNKI